MSTEGPICIVSSLPEYVPAVEEIKRVPANTKDRHAVAVCKEATVVGHVPYNLAPRISQFLLRDVLKLKAFAEVAGKKSTGELAMD